MQFNKTLVAAALVLGSTVAQSAETSSVTLYGLIDLGLQYSTVSSPSLNSQSHLGMASGQSRPTIFGIKGIEDLGNGNAVVFNLASNFNASNGSLADSGNLFNQQATLGVRNSTVGLVELGRQTNMASKYFQAIDPFVTFYGQAGMGSSFGATNNARYSNMIMWQSNNYNGFTAGAGYSFNTGNTGAYVTPSGAVVTDGSYNYSTTNNQRAITLGANYVSGPLTVTATYDQIMPQDGVGNNAPTPKQWIVGGSYDFQVVKASLAYGQTRNGWIAGTQPMNGSGLNPSWTNGAVLYNEGFAVNSYLVGLSAPVTVASKVFASYQAANPVGNLSGVGSAQSIYSVGYDYNFSKRTTAYAAVSYANNYMMIDGAKSTVLMTGVRHQF